ncbi:MAG: hypothetical protein F6K19_23005 [Cyanothece sp. SIO1E1]|nr:hypothetical protein [Cyanothece sp. SIO1E1]
MSRRSRKHRKRFACGHRGFGQQCHRCAKVKAQKRAKLSERRAQRQQWQATFAQDPIDLGKLPCRIVLKAREVLAALAQGRGYWQLAGKRLNPTRDIIRIPVTYRYRLLCRDNGRSLVPLKVVSHEDYNSLVRHPNRHLIRAS